MARPLWSGAIRFGLVNIPVQLYTAVREKDVRFHQLHKEDGGRVRYQRVCELDGKEVDYDDIVRGYEIAKGEYVTVTPEELEALSVEAARAIDIERFVRLEEIDPVYFSATYHLVSDDVSAPAYALLQRAMQGEGRVALGRVVIRSREKPCAIRSVDGGLVLNLLHHADELVAAPGAAATRKELPKPGEKELAMARQLIETLAGDFDPEQFKDTYREQVLELVRKKAEGEEIVSHAPPLERTGKVVDLMAALEQSLARRKAAESGAAKAEPKAAARGGSKAAASAAAKGEKRAPQRKAARKTRSSKGS